MRALVAALPAPSAAVVAAKNVLRVLVTGPAFDRLDEIRACRGRVHRRCSLQQLDHCRPWLAQRSVVRPTAIYYIGGSPGASPIPGGNGPGVIVLILLAVALQRNELRPRQTGFESPSAPMSSVRGLPPRNADPSHDRARFARAARLAYRRHRHTMSTGLGGAWGSVGRRPATTTKCSDRKSVSRKSESSRINDLRLRFAKNSKVGRGRIMLRTTFVSASRSRRAVISRRRRRKTRARNRSGPGVEALTPCSSPKYRSNASDGFGRRSVLARFSRIRWRTSSSIDTPISRASRLSQTLSPGSMSRKMLVALVAVPPVRPAAVKGRPIL